MFKVISIKQNKRQNDTASVMDQKEKPKWTKKKTSPNEKRRQKIKAHLPAIYPHNG